METESLSSLNSGLLCILLIVMFVPLWPYFGKISKSPISNYKKNDLAKLNRIYSNLHIYWIFKEISGSINYEVK